MTISLLTASLNFFKSKGRVFNLPTSRSSFFVFILFEPGGTLSNLLISSLSSSTPLLQRKLLLVAKLDV